MTSVNQDALDYSNDAQQRVAADTRCLIKKQTLTVVSGAGSYDLPGDVIQVKAVLDTDRDVPYLRVDDALAYLSRAADTDTSLMVPSYYVLAGQIGFAPTPTDTKTYTIVYEARPAQLTSASDFELVDDYELLIDRLVQAYKLADDGQPELAAEEQAWYDTEYPRLRRRRRREIRGRVPVIGYDVVDSWRRR